MRRNRNARGLCVLFAVLVVVFAIFVGSAGATTASGTDPAADNTPAKDARGDIRTYSVTYDSPSITVSATTTSFDNPATSQNWIQTLTGILYGLDTNQ